MTIYHDKRTTDNLLGAPSHARATTPDGLKIKKSIIQGLGVFSRLAIPKDTCFGPFIGRKLITLSGYEDLRGYAWEVSE